MKYFIDTEFHEYKRKVRFLGFTIAEIPTIELISIGIVCEDGREYYAISNEFNVSAAWRNEWLRENVLKSIHNELLDFLPNRHEYWNQFKFSKLNLMFLLDENAKSNLQIADEIKHFIGGSYSEDEFGLGGWEATSGHEFYAYYADYDWVAFCWLFGRMIDLPNGFPRYCKDLKQILDDKVKLLDRDKWKKKYCPDPENEHNALADAGWNLKLFRELEKIK